MLILLNDEEWAKWNDSEIAKQCAVAHSFVWKLRQEILSCLKDKIGQDRKAQRGGKVYTMKTGNLIKPEMGKGKSKGQNVPLKPSAGGRLFRT